MPDKRDDPDWLFQNHPDLIDPEWARKARKAARKYDRRRRFTVRRRRPAGKRGSPAGNRPAGRRGGPVGWLAARATASPTVRARTVMIVVVVVIGAVLVAQHPWTTDPATAFGPAPVRNSESAPTTSPMTSDWPAPLDMQHPFGNTPAAHWSDGAAGIVLPAPRAVGSYSAAQVTADETKVKQILVTAHLSPQVLINHDPTAYLALLAPDSRTYERQQLAKAPDGYGTITALAKGFPLLPVPVKVAGSMSASLDPAGNVEVHTNYVYAFPFAPTGAGILITQTWQIVAIHHVQEDFEVITSSRYRPSSQGVRIAGAKSYYASMACQQAKKGYLAPAFSELVGDGPTTDSPYAYYDPNHPMNVGTC